MGGTTVTVGGESLFIDYVSPGQVNGQVPSDVATGPQQVIVTTAAGSSAPFTINVNPTEPGLLAPAPFKISGIQYAVALFSDGFYDLPPGSGFRGGFQARGAGRYDHAVWNRLWSGDATALKRA